MKKHLLLLGLLLSFVFFSGPVAAQKELAEVVKAAEKEGEVLWTSVLYEEEAAVFVKAFQKEYPKIKVVYTRQHGGEAMELLKREYQTGRIMYDVVQIQVLDPPKFAHTTAQAERAARGYKDINLLAMKLVRLGGHLVTFSCSGGVSEELFRRSSLAQPWMLA